MRESIAHEGVGAISVARGRTTSRATRNALPVLYFAGLCLYVILQSACAGTVGGSSSPPPAPPPPNIVVTVSPKSPSVPTGGGQVFTATVTGADGASTDVTWSVNSVPGGNLTIGTIAASSGTTALYTAPAAVPSPAVVTVTATSVADTSASGSASLTITCTATNWISPPSASVGLGQVQSFAASFCLAAGATVTWDVNRIANGNSSLGTITVAGSESVTYTAPTSTPANNPVTIHATASSVTDGGSTTESATVTITSSVTVSVSPPAAAVLTGQRMSFAALVGNTSDTAVTWSVEGVLNGNTALGQICQPGTSPCAAPTGPTSGSVDYLAPATVPSPNPVTLVATSHADPSRTGMAAITISPSSGLFRVTISPTYAFVPASGGSLSTQQFFASVTGAGNTSVNWTVRSAALGLGCAGSTCGSVSASGLYSAPGAAPSPNAISVVATSAADPTKSASATVAVLSGPTIEVLLPSSAMAGAVEGFSLAVQGTSFVAGSGSAASVILINGAARTTTCATTLACTTVLNPSDVAAAGTLTVQVQNPGSSPALSNPVPFAIVPFDVSVGTISLTPGEPVATGNDIVVVEATTAAASSPINVDFIGFLTGGNNCGVQGSPLTVTRPSSGSTSVSICVHGTGLDPTFTYAFSGPSAAPNASDIGITASAVSGLFPNMIDLTLQISSSTLPGVRTLFITTPNNDRAVATGMLEVK